MTKMKKIAACTAAAMMAFSTMAVSAFAEYDSTTEHSDVPQYLSGSKVFGVVAADEYKVEGLIMPYNYTAGTFYYGDGEMYVSLDIDNYVTGALLDRKNRTGCDTTELPGVFGVAVGSNKNYGVKVSLFTAHEAYSSDGEAWGEYLGLISV